MGAFDPFLYCRRCRLPRVPSPLFKYCRACSKLARRASHKRYRDTHREQRRERRRKRAELRGYWV